MKEKITKPEPKLPIDKKYLILNEVMDYLEDKYRIDYLELIKFRKYAQELASFKGNTVVYVDVERLSCGEGVVADIAKIVMDEFRWYMDDIGFLEFWLY